MRGLIAVGVLADQSGNVRLFAADEFLFGRKKPIELFREFDLPAIEFCQSIYVMWNKKRILPTVSLSEMERNLIRLKRFQKTAIPLWPEEFSFGIK